MALMGPAAGIEVKAMIRSSLIVVVKIDHALVSPGGHINTHISGPTLRVCDSVGPG